MLMVMLSMSVMACADGHLFAPVTDGASIEHIPKNGIHRVRAGETLYSIAWRYGLDFRELATRNKLKNSYHIEVGEIIYLRGTAASHHTAAIQSYQPVNVAVSSQQILSQPDFEMDYEKEPVAQVNDWQWPAHGSVSGAFSATNKGINILGVKGQPIFATAAGKVVYSGDGLRGYGNLIIIKHNSIFLTAYAHNSRNLVTEGQLVKAGQVIAQMGKTGARRVMLHFEIRRSGDPVNPLDYLRS
jgi:lipoprotein NlpD